MNDVLDIVLVAWLPTTPWPPGFFDSFDAFANADEAARYVRATSTVVVAPSAGRARKLETLAFEEHVPELGHDVFWPAGRLRGAPRRRKQVLSAPQFGRARLDELAARPLATFLRAALPHAVRSAYVRRILVLDAMPDRVPPRTSRADQDGGDP